MKEPKHIPEPTLKSATALSAIEMNKIRFSSKRTLLTPERLKK